jgi:hypothetical protein
VVEMRMSWSRRARSFDIVNNQVQLLSHLQVVVDLSLHALTPHHISTLRLHKVESGPDHPDPRPLSCTATCPSEELTENV